MFNPLQYKGQIVGIVTNLDVAFAMQCYYLSFQRFSVVGLYQLSKDMLTHISSVNVVVLNQNNLRLYSS